MGHFWQDQRPESDSRTTLLTKPHENLSIQLGFNRIWNELDANFNGITYSLTYMCKIIIIEFHIYCSKLTRYKHRHRQTLRPISLS